MHPVTALAIALCSAGVSVAALAEDQSRNVDLSAVEPAIELFARDFPGLSVTVLSGGETVLSRQYGVRDIESGDPVTAETRFNIYSVSKLITGLALLRDVHQGRLSLDDRVRTISPALPAVFDGVTVRHLLTHRSGVRHYQGREDWIAFADRRCAAPADAIAYFGDEPLRFEPGSDELYTTFGMVVASQVLVDLHGAAGFDEALASALAFDPGVRLDAEEAAKATPYYIDGDTVQPLVPMSAECKFAGGGLIASSAELAEVGRAAYSGRIAPIDDLRALLLDGRGAPDGFYSYAMGVGRAAFGEGEEEEQALYLVMGGGSPGGRGYLLVLVEPQIAVAITANAEGDGDAAAQLAQSLARAALGSQ